jgi:Tol biopolymer transport system component
LRFGRIAVVSFVCWCGVGDLLAQREPVLKQIDLPHPYYFREMYLPQLTTGPSAVTWLPGSRSVVYSMAGSLWRQPLESNVAEQLTDGPGYDYQPDCSRDGHWVIYTKYDHDALELWAFDLENRGTRQLTRGGVVNVEPRFSPDGKRIAFVSTQYKGHFHIFIADFEDGELKNVRQLTSENRSTLPRYYYSAFDHEISPAWSPDGSEVLFISNRGHIYGTGGLWHVKSEPGAEAREIHHEETEWKARPDFSPDGKRIVYASYAGRQWQQLWTMPSDGGDTIPLSFGEYDNVGPRWSPDGKTIAFVSNGHGNTSLWTQEALGGAQKQIIAKERRYLHAMANLSIRVLDPSGKQTPARIFVTGENGLAYAPENAWMQADDSFVRAERPFETHYFDSQGQSTLSVPAGRVRIEVMKGFEYAFARQDISIAQGDEHVIVSLNPLQIPLEPNQQWVSGDVHLHMNYGGTYRNTPEHLIEQAQAENLSVVENLVVNKEQRIPDISYFRPYLDPASTTTTLLFHGQEFHTSYWGHLGLLNLTDHFLLPDFAVYPETSAASLFPPNAVVADLAHAQHGLVGYAHPFDSLPDPADKSTALTDELPVDVALGKVDYIEVLGFSDHKATTEVWYRLLNCGFHLPAAAGTDAMANYASLRGPVGLNRVYAAVPKGKTEIGPWLDSLKHGRTFATNGPLLGFSLGSQQIGGNLKLAANTTVKFTAWLRSFVPVDHLQIVCDGEIVRELPLAPARQSANVTGDIAMDKSGWCLLRALSDKSEFPVLDSFPYATTGPIYVDVAGKPQVHGKDAAYFVAWIDRLVDGAENNSAWNTAEEKQIVMKLLQDARAVYAGKAR